MPFRQVYLVSEFMKSENVQYSRVPFFKMMPPISNYPLKLG